MSDSVEKVLKEALTPLGVKRIANRSKMEFSVGRQTSEKLYSGKFKVAKKMASGGAMKAGTPKRASKKTGKSTASVPAKSNIYVQVTGRKPSYYSLAKSEFVELLCGSHKRYAPLRKQFSTYSKESQATIVGVIAAAIGAQIGIAAVVLGPTVGIFLLIFLQVGKNAFCAGRVS